MKHYRGLIKFAVFIVVCAAIIWIILHITAEYPALGEPVSYEVNNIEGFNLTIEEPTYSIFKGYSIRYEIEIDSEEVYYLDNDSQEFEFLECYIDGQWYRLECQNEAIGFNVWDVGGRENTGFQGSLVQKYAGYGTRLEAGTYRFIMELTDQYGEFHYLAAEFNVE